jgi:hypothetical protein
MEPIQLLFRESDNFYMEDINRTIQLLLGETGN